MASFIAPPGHYAQIAAMVTAKYAGVKITLEAPDADLKAGSFPV